MINGRENQRKINGFGCNWIEMKTFGCFPFYAYYQKFYPLGIFSTCTRLRHACDLREKSNIITSFRWKMLSNHPNFIDCFFFVQIFFRSNVNLMKLCRGNKVK